ncbi:hypothetical protein [Streptomyces albiaxialis]|uniref:hypothetical protein n=1 Tax=Streptomyces albiaxialis TaxID=329523 RepID=UPI0031DE9197
MLPPPALPPVRAATPHPATRSPTPDAYATAHANVYRRTDAEETTEPNARVRVRAFAFAFAFAGSHPAGSWPRDC